MSKIFVPLKYTSGFSGIYLKPISGAVQLNFEKNNLSNLLDLLDELILPNENGNKPKAGQIVIADRDEILAALYISVFGEKIESTVICKNCEQKFDLDFALKNLLTHSKSPQIFSNENGVYQLDTNISFRLPTGNDELAISGLSKNEAENNLYIGCLLTGNPKTSKEIVQQEMEKIAPVLNIDMQAICPECNHLQIVKFDIQTFFSTKLIQERTQLFNEIHALATNYHWSKSEILELPRSLRKRFFDMIQSNN